MGFKNQMMFLAATAALIVGTVQGEVSLGYFQQPTMKDVDGEVVVVSQNVLEVRGFTYDGSAPDAFFWADASANASDAGFILFQADKNCSKDILDYAAGNETILLEFPANTSILDIAGGSISVWCRTMKVNMGQVDVPTTGLEEGSGLLVSPEEETLLCANVEEEGLLDTLVGQVKTYWNIVRWLPSKLYNDYIA